MIWWPCQSWHEVCASREIVAARMAMPCPSCGSTGPHAIAPGRRDPELHEASPYRSARVTCGCGRYLCWLPQWRGIDELARAHLARAVEAGITAAIGDAGVASVRDLLLETVSSTDR